MRSRSAGAMPGPVSLHGDHAAPAVVGLAATRAVTRIEPPAGVNLTALLSKLPTARANCRASMLAVGRSSGMSLRQAMPFCSAPARQTTARSLSHGRERRGRALQFQRPEHLGVQRGELGQQRLQPVDLRVDARQQLVAQLRLLRRPLAQGVDRRAQRAQRAPQLVHQVGQQPAPGGLQRAQPLHQPVDRLIEFIDFPDALVGQGCLRRAGGHVVEGGRGAAQPVVQTERERASRCPRWSAAARPPPPPATGSPARSRSGRWPPRGRPAARPAAADRR